jgi:hypothetical protein
VGRRALGRPGVEVCAKAAQQPLEAQQAERAQQADPRPARHGAHPRAPDLVDPASAHLALGAGAQDEQLVGETGLP